MKKIVMFLILLSGYAYSQCSDIPTCESLGYSKTTTECAGQDILKCPFDYNKVFCLTYEKEDEEACHVGSFLYYDKKCSSTLVLGKVLAGIVVDPTKKLAIALTELEKPWNSSGSDYNYLDVPNLTNYSSSEEALADFNGKSNTSIILAFRSTYQAAKYCNEMNVVGKGFEAGNWYFPALGEISLIYQNKALLNSSLKEVLGAIQISDSTYSSSSEHSWSNYFWGQYFLSGKTFNYSRATAYPVRCMVQY